MPQFTWLTFAQARQLLAARLADPTNLFWTDAECGAYIIEALRTYNSLTEIWLAEYPFQATSAAGPWYDLSTPNNSPRRRTLTDNDLVTMMQFHLLEVPAGNVVPWQGTTQFSLDDLEGALQRRRDAMIQMTGCNMSRLPNLASTPNTVRTIFPDNVLEPRRVRFLPTSPTNPMTLTKEDTLAFDYYEPDHAQQSSTPLSWSVVVGPPLAMDVDYAPNQPGVYDVIYLKSGNVFNAPARTLLSVPDDFAWVAKWGALADLLGRESEATDRARAAYCMQRWMDGIKIMQHSNWIARATINGIPADTPSMAEMDNYSPDWEENASATPSLITAGMDYIAACPVTVLPSGINLTLVGNAPVPSLDADYVQASRDTFDALLDYAQHVASFKMGGEEFAQTKPLLENFVKTAMSENDRLAHMGIYTDVLKEQGQRENLNQQRYSERG